MRVVTLIAALVAMLNIVSAQCPTCVSDATTNCTYTISGNVNNPSYNLNGSDRLCIMPGAVITGFWNINVNSSNARIINYGSIIIDQLNLNNGSLINYGRMNIGGNLILGNAAVHNYNYLRVGGDFNLNSTQSVMCNTDTIIVNNNFNTTGRSMNNGYVLVTKTFQQNAQGDWCTTNYGLVYCDDLTLNGDVYGSNAACLGFIVADVTTVNGSGTLAGTVDICDQNFTASTTPRLDYYSGPSIGANVTYCNCSQTPLGHYITQSDAYLVADEVRISWKTGYLSSGLEFEVERWANNTFVTAARLSGKVGDNTYTTYLPAGSESEQRFRIKAMDAVGSVEYSPVMHVNLDAHTSLEAIAYPVPSHGEVQLSISGVAESSVKISLMDAQGRTLWEDKREASELSAFNLRLAPALFPSSGSYWVRVTTPTDALVVPVLVQR